MPTVVQPLEWLVVTLQIYRHVFARAATLAAKQALAKTRGISIDQVTVEKLERVTWPNTCLGVALKGMACQEFQTPGFRIVLSAGGKTYEYHTNLDGSQVIGVP